MSIELLRQRRATVYLSITGMLLMAAAVSALSASDTSGVALRAGVIMVVVAAGLLLPWRAAIPAAGACWLFANLARALVADWSLLNDTMLLELPGLLGLAGFSMAIRHSLRLLESDSRVVGGDDHYGIEPDTGVYEERFLRPAIEAELSRSRRFDREFALIVVGIDELHLRFDYRSDEEWRAGFLATAQLLRRTRNNIDRVYRYGPAGFALVLPESGPQEATGLVRRLRRLARSSRPREGDPGGPLPVSFGATFFPTCATTVDDLLRRADIAQRLAEKNTDHLQLDSAAAPAGPAPETLRREPETEEDTTLAAEPVVTVGPLTNGAAGSNGHQVEDDMVELLKRFDETRALLHRLRTGEPVEKAS